ncbi:radical sam, pyruvate-formate lyase-activating enzyme like [hydrocarbon metagenome]|uniref:Radical sam, pyruvate-formate lyase-activating enzyme like n=1 Tax=hydrocarbon metagenome TaxID=938273 RepID=A0A0W8FEN3_9ZZZZ|nr:radical SAM protein [Methanomicrobiaceae archaeon]
MADDETCCELCEWRCRADRAAGERGVCRVGRAEVAATSFALALRSYSVTLTGCCYRCLHCNAYRISQYPDPGWQYRGHLPPSVLASEALERIRGFSDFPIERITFTGGDPIIHLPYIEAVAAAIREEDAGIGIGLATGGFATPETIDRIIRLCSSITLEIKAFDDPVHRALTGAPAAPVLRNAGILGRRAFEKIRVFRTVVIPGVTDGQVEGIAGFIASIDSDIPYRLIGFRPNFVLYYHAGPPAAMMERLAERCREQGLTDVAWSGYYPEGDAAHLQQQKERLVGRYGGSSPGALAGAYAASVGCPTHPRNCGGCPLRDRCPVTLREPWNRR